MIWAYWYSYVLPEVPGVPAPMLDHYLRQAAINFFEESQVWTVTLDPISLIADTGTYGIVAPAQTVTAAPLLSEVPDISMVKWAWVDGNQIFPSSQEELSMQNARWDTITSGAVRNYTQLTQDTITLWPIPNYASTGGLIIKAALRPSLTASGVPDWLGVKYVQEVAMKTKADLMGMVNQPWTNEKGEAKYSAAYASALTKATVEGNKSFTRTSMAVRFRNYG